MPSSVYSLARACVLVAAIAALNYGWVEGLDGRRIGDRVAIDVKPPATAGTPMFIFMPRR